MWTNLPHGVVRCRHIKVNGTRCDSPALKGKAYCYFHYRSRLHDPAAASPISPSSKSQELAGGSQELPPAGVPLNAEFFLLEDADSIQCALQWVLRRILAASIDRRQAALLLYGLQIASANIKKTTFEPYYKKVIRDLPAPDPAETNLSPCHLERAPTDPMRGESKDLASLPATRAAQTANEPSADASILVSTPPATGREPTAGSPTASPDSRLLTPESPQPPPSPKRASRRPRGAGFAVDRRMLASSPRAALSLMFQREVKRHLARLDFPSSPDADP